MLPEHIAETEMHPSVRQLASRLPQKTQRSPVKVRILIAHYFRWNYYLHQTIDAFLDHRCSYSGIRISSVWLMRRYTVADDLSTSQVHPGSPGSSSCSPSPDTEHKTSQLSHSDGREPSHGPFAKSCRIPNCVSPRLFEHEPMC
jgi:hypothetical protein